VPETPGPGNSAAGIPNYRWDEIFDVVVVGSGGGALTAALLAARGGAGTVVVEKSEFIGGTTAVSGGDMWIPNNRFVAGQDSREDAIAYLTRLSDGRAADPGLIEVYVDSAPEAFEYLLETTGYDSEPHISLDDYYSVIGDRIPGVRHFPRTCAVKPYPAGAELGLELARKINRGPWVPPAEISFPEQRRGAVGREELAKRRREVWRAKGGGLIAPLLKGLVDAGVEVRTSTPAVKLVDDGAGAVIGAVVEGPGGPRRIGARRGVVLACGGFEWNAEMVKTFIGYEVKPLTPWENTGDGHLMAMEVGAKLGSMTSFFSYGVVYELWEKGRDGKPLPQMIMGLGPGSIIVNSHGKRFMHGGYTYNDFSAPFGFFDQRNPGFTNKPPAWNIFGADVLEGGIMGAKPGISLSLSGPDGQEPPDWIQLAGSVRELAGKIGIDPDALEATVERYNQYAEKGEDPDWGDPDQTSVLTGPDTVHRKPVTGPPFGAIQQWPGTIGTNGGLRIDQDARVLGYRVPVIDGLYAAGNTSASVLGSVYAGGGSCIGPSVTMGYRAGRHLAGRESRDIGTVSASGPSAVTLSSGAQSSSAPSSGQEAGQ
jgi:succinate dehydrogenase/fumarate reductase flavoprotein subunit